MIRVFNKISLIIGLVMCGACTIIEPNYDLPWMRSGHGEVLEEIAYDASNNARLTAAMIARIDSGLTNIAEIRTFIFITQHAWSEHASKVIEELDLFEGH